MIVRFRQFILAAVLLAFATASNAVIHNIDSGTQWNGACDESHYSGSFHFDFHTAAIDATDNYISCYAYEIGGRDGMTFGDAFLAAPPITGWYIRDGFSRSDATSAPFEIDSVDVYLSSATTMTITRYDSDRNVAGTETRNITTTGSWVTVNLGSDYEDLSEVEFKLSAPQLAYISNYDIIPPDSTPPRVSSIVRQTPSTSPTNADAVTWRVTFDEGVQNVDTTDFSAAGTTAAITNVTAVNASTYDVTLSGGDLANLNATVTLGFAGGQNIQDLATNALSNTTPTGTNNNSYSIINDTAPPEITSITRQNPNASPTASDSLVWRITFNEAVKNVDATDFTRNGTTASISNVSTVSASIYDVTLSGGDLAGVNGTVTLGFSSGHDIQDIANNDLASSPTPSGTNDNSFVLDNTAPRITNITRQNPGSLYTANDAVIWQVRFDEGVQNVNTGDFSVSGTTATINNVSTVNASTYNLTLSGGDLADLNGTVTLSLAGGQNIEDLVGNGLSNTSPTGTNDNTFIIDNISPTVQILNAPSKHSALTSFNITIQFSEIVTGFTESDITVSNANLSNFVAVDGDTYTVDVFPTGAGDVTIDVAMSLSQDRGGNDNEVATQVNIAIDAIKPTLDILSAPDKHSALAPFKITFEFSETVVGFTVGDISATHATLSNFTQVDGNTYTVDMLASGAGDVAIDIAEAVAHDEVGNPNEAATQVVVPIDAIQPTVEILNAPVEHITREPFNITLEFSEDVFGFEAGDITVTNASVTNFVAVDGNTYTADIETTAAGDVTIDIAEAVTHDSVGNPNIAAIQVAVICGIGCGEQATIDHTVNALRNFAGNRIRHITAHGPGLSGFLTDDGTGGGINGFLGQLPIGLNFDGNSNNQNGSFSSSLQQMQKLQNNVNAGESGNPLVAPAASPENIWIKGRWSKINDDRAGIGDDTDFGIIYLGADYRFSEDLLIGILAQYDWFEQSSSALNSQGEGEGWMIGPYIVTRLKDSLTMDMRFAWGRSDNKINPIGTYWDDYKSERWQVEGNLTGSFKLDNWHIAPSIGLNYFQDTQKSYTDTNGFIIPENKVELGTLVFGPKITYNYADDNGLRVSPFITVNGVWDFEAPDLYDASGIASGTEELRAKLGFGVDISSDSGTSVSASYTYDGIGISHYESHTAELAAMIRLDSTRLPEGSTLSASYSLQNLLTQESRDAEQINLRLNVPFH